jgi:hypothetical protein
LPWLIVTAGWSGLVVRAATLVGAHPARALAVTAAVASLALACGVPLLARLRRR